MKAQSPLDIQELLKLSLSFLAEHPKELSACSLVAHSWVGAAQTILFRAPHLTNWSVVTTNRTALKLYDALTASPHLARHVRALSLKQYTLSPSTESKILCQVGFHRLETLSLEIMNLPNWADKVGALLRSPTLRNLELLGPGPFTRLVPSMANFSPTIRHLEIRCIRWDLIEPSVESRSLPPIHIESLYFRVFTPDVKDAERLDAEALYPFVLDRLNYLAVWNTRSILWDTIPVSVKESIETLQIKLRGSDLVDLSSFLQLSVLHLILEPLQSVPPGFRYTLKTVSASHRIQTITIWIGHSKLCDDEEYEKLDEVLSSMPLNPTPMVEFESSIKGEGEGRVDRLKSLFPKVVAKDKFRVAYLPWNIDDIGRGVLKEYAYFKR
ncbi:hypothetical protein R3P38DRAFT_3097600 [Favolaschia claudopus]|uniref:F-box domain-containing protein n=1 Tax=Favolaschia claudopus TaxID=2862362 RepID=A0AAV9ZP35_9AGAR